MLFSMDWACRICGIINNKAKRHAAPTRRKACAPSRCLSCSEMAEYRPEVPFPNIRAHTTKGELKLGCRKLRCCCRKSGLKAGLSADFLKCASHQNHYKKKRQRLLSAF